MSSQQISSKIFDLKVGMTDKQDELSFWRLCAELTVVQAALLVIGIDPAAEQDFVEKSELHDRPVGYEATKSAISNALRLEQIKGTKISYYRCDINGEKGEEIENSVDPRQSMVEVESLRAWLIKREFNDRFFFPQAADTPAYLNRNHPNYAPKLAAAICAWEGVTTDKSYQNNGKHTKQNLVDWLTEHADEFQLKKSNGDIKNDAIKNQIAKVANWDDKGGAPSTPG